MQILKFKPFSKKEFIEDLKRTFPQYRIRTSFGAIQVRTRGFFSLTGNVKININPKTGRVSTQTKLDSPLFLILFFPIGLYVMMNKNKIKYIENKVVEGMDDVLEEETDILLKYFLNVG